MPESPCQYLSDWFSKAGRCLQGFNGIMPLTWQEITSFFAANKIDYLDWEAEAIRKMSESYCSWHSMTSQDNNIDPPLIPDDEALALIQAANGRRMKAMMRPS